jgi:hypothetical protein
MQIFIQLDKKLTAVVTFVCLALLALSGCTTYNELANTSDTIIFTPRQEQGAKGEVVYSKLGCPHFLVNTILGYAALKLVAGKIPRVGDSLVGDFESYGEKKILNSSNGLDIIVAIENFWLTKDRAMEIYYEKCIQP